MILYRGKIIFIFFVQIIFYSCSRNEFSGDSELTMQKIESGSVRIYLEGTEIGFRRIESLFKEQKTQQAHHATIKCM